MIVKLKSSINGEVDKNEFEDIIKTIEDSFKEGLIFCHIEIKDKEILTKLKKLDYYHQRVGNSNIYKIA